MKTALLMLFTLLPSLIFAQEESYGEWTSVNGVKLKAALVSFENGTVNLKKEDGSIVKISLTALSKEDQLKAVIPADALGFEGHYYKLFSDTTDWRKADVKCRNRGGYLVIIESETENNFVYQMMKAHSAVWIGLSKQMNEWRWVKKTDSSFFKWAPGEPNSNQGNPSPRMGVSVAIRMYGEWHSGSVGKKAMAQSESLRSRWDDYLGDGAGVTGYVCEWGN